MEVRNRLKTTVLGAHHQGLSPFVPNFFACGACQYLKLHPRCFGFRPPQLRRETAATHVALAAGEEVCLLDKHLFGLVSGVAGASGMNAKQFLSF